MKIQQPQAMDLRWTVIVVSIGVVLTTILALYWISTASYSSTAQ